jgi:hypothetical protein
MSRAVGIRAQHKPVWKGHQQSVEWPQDGKPTGLGSIRTEVADSVHQT